MLSGALFAAALLLPGAQSFLYHPNLQTYLLEHILVDNWGTYASNFSSAITPCTRYVTQTGEAALNSGRTTAAQWMRVLFHDVITANASAGTGGVDASIGFETARGENSGSAFNDSFTFWRPFVNGAVSMADLIALGTVMSTNLCGGRTIPYRPGRIDATTAGVTTGVPAPETDLEETLLFFERAGFNKEDAIAFTACGHTMGSVHHGGFPDVVDETAVTPSNMNGGANFDTSRGVFDQFVVREYVEWTGLKGGPLVTTSNVSTQSDLRLYESDGNKTMRSLLAQGDGFLDTCVDLFGQAIHTVPAGVQLEEVIEAVAVKPINTTFDFGPHGSLMLSGKIRILTPAASSPPTSLTLQTKSHSVSLLPEPETGTSAFGRTGSGANTVYGTTTYFSFSLQDEEAQTTTFFSVSGAGIETYTFPVQSEIFVVPSETALSGSAINATIATRNYECADLRVSVATPLAQLGTLAPRIVRQELEAVEALGPSFGSSHSRCNCRGSLEGIPTGLVTLTVSNGGDVVDTLLVNGGAAGW